MHLEPYMYAIAVIRDGYQMSILTCMCSLPRTVRIAKSSAFPAVHALQHKACYTSSHNLDPKLASASPMKLHP